MLHWAQESAFLKLVWVEGESFAGWGCAECGWTFNPSEPPIGESLDEVKEHFQAQLSKQFLSHSCASRSRARGAAS
jgi:rubredoxin